MTVSYTFSPNTKIKSSEVNQNFSDVLKSVNRQDKATNSTVSNQVMVFGWQFGTGNGSNTVLTPSVTFPFTYSSVPVVAGISFLGFKDGSDPSTIADFTGITGTPLYFCDVSSITTGSFVMRIHDTTFAAITNARRLGFSFIVIGS